MWVGARTHVIRDEDAKWRAAKRGRIRASSAHRSFSRIWARDFLGRKSRRKRSAAERRAPSLPFFYFPSLFREPACGRAARAVSQSEAARVDEDSKKGKIRAPFLPVSRLYSATSVFDGGRMSRTGEERQQHRQHAEARGRVDGRRPRAPIRSSTESGAADVARPRAPRVEIHVSDGLGVACGAPPNGRSDCTGAPGDGRHAARRGRQTAAATPARRGAQQPRPRAGAAGAHAAGKIQKQRRPAGSGTPVLCL